MLTKLSITNQILILLGVLVVGLIIGNVVPSVNTWFASTPNTGNGTGNGTAQGRYGCPTVGGVECCRPKRWRFNNSANEFQCL